MDVNDIAEKLRLDGAHDVTVEDHGWGVYALRAQGDITLYFEERWSGHLICLGTEIPADWKPEDKA